jgi:endoglucanase
VLAAALATVGMLAGSAGAAQATSGGSGATGASAPTPATRTRAAAGSPPLRRVVGSQLVDASGHPVRLLGVDVSGTEDSCVEGGKISGWGPFDTAEAKSIAAWHVNAVRVPLDEDCWLGINGAPSNFSAATYRSQISSWVADLNAVGIVAILDLHWSAPGANEAVGQWPMPDVGHSVNFWSQVATAFKSNPSVIFDLFNEPYLGRGRPTAADWLCWRNGCSSSQDPCPNNDPSACITGISYQVAGMQQLLDAVRATGAAQPVMVGGLNWAGDPCGVRDQGGNGGACTWLTYEPTDPDHQLIDSFHTYNWTACTTVTCWESSVHPVAQQVPVVTTELGEKDCSSQYVDRYLAWANRNGISYLAWSWQPPLGKSTGCGAANLDLLSDWKGTPNSANPAASVFQGNLDQLAATHQAQLAASVGQ